MQEVKQLKVNTLNQDKTALGVAIKSAKQESKEQCKCFDKKVEVYEKKILELNEFRTRKLKKEKLRRKKELKKEARKLRITMKMK